MLIAHMTQANTAMAFVVRATRTLLAGLAAGLLTASAFAQTAVVRTVLPTSTATGSANGVGMLAACGTLPSQAYSSFSAAQSAVKNFVLSCPE